MTRYCSLFRRLLSTESKGEEADEEEGSTRRDSSQQGESSPDSHLYTQVLMTEVRLGLFVSCLVVFIIDLCGSRKDGKLLVQHLEREKKVMQETKSDIQYAHRTRTDKRTEI